MKERDERHTEPAHGSAAKPDKPASEQKRRFQDAIEDDDVREALGVSHQHKPVTQSGV
jgi:hypothetical protein